MEIDGSARYQSIPWVSKLLQDDSFITIPSTNREKKSSTEDNLFAATLKSDDTLSGCLTQYRYSPSSSAVPENIEEVRMFFTLGDGMNGYPGILHGGIVATLLDEGMGLLLTLRSNYKASNDRATSSKTVTAYLNTNFLRPVQTPGVIVLYARLDESKENRKWKIKGRICDSEDQVLATAECLYVKSQSKI